LFAQAGKDVRINFVAKTLVLDLGMHRQERFIPGDQSIAWGELGPGKILAGQVDFHPVAFEVSQTHASVRLLMPAQPLIVFRRKAAAGDH
jgi:hypothetical protein